MVTKLIRNLCLLSVSLFALNNATAGTLVLEGSDATGYHAHQEGGAEYSEQLFSYMIGGSSKPMLVFGSAPYTPDTPAGTVYTTDLSGLSIDSYSALYIQSPYGCCDQNRSGAAAFGAQIGAFYAAGGSVAIMNYQGGDWSFLSPLLATPAAGAVKGYNTGGGGAICTDGEVFNSEALSRGFTQPPALGCWEHQAYSLDYFGALGFISLVDSAPEYFGLNNDGSARGSALLAFGGALGTPGCTDPTGATCGGTSVPEPGSLPLLAFGVLCLLFRIKRTKA